jgi:hypothetical protein
VHIPMGFEPGFGEFDSFAAHHFSPVFTRVFHLLGAWVPVLSVLCVLLISIPV